MKLAATTVVTDMVAIMHPLFHANGGLWILVWLRRVAIPSLLLRDGAKTSGGNFKTISALLSFGLRPKSCKYELVKMLILTVELRADHQPLKSQT